MVKCFKLLLVVASLGGLAACDSADKPASQSDAAPATSQSAPAASQPAAPAEPAAPAAKGKEIKAIDGKVTLTIPDSFTEQQGGSDMMKVYADMAKQHSVLVITTPAMGNSDMLDAQLKATQDALKAQDSNLEVVKQGSVKAGNLDMKQLTVKMTAAGQSVFSYTALGIVGDKQLTLQFTAPEKEQGDFQKVVESILASVKAQ